ncbi:MAG: AI-2E family transporter [Pseudomonadota bacterium]
MADSIDTRPDSVGSDQEGGEASSANAAPTPASALRPRSSTAAIVLASLAVAYTLWATQELLLPVLLAMFFALIGNPIIRTLEKIHIPRFVGALAVLSAGLACAVLLGSLMAEPAGKLMREMPHQLREIAPKLRAVVKPVQDAKKGAESIARVAGGEDVNAVRLVRTEVNDPFRSLTATPRMIASVLAVVLLTLFFMIYGANLQRRVLALLPGWQQKKLTMDILQSMEREMSRYVLTITIINTLLGLAFAGVLVWLGLAIPEALMWGTLAALLNYAPYVGPLIGIMAMMLLGFVHFDAPLEALLPSAIYLLLHTIEGQFVTPILLGRRMALSPLVLILGLMVFGWLWGIIGLLLAVPLLACTKVVLERVDGLGPWARLLE